MKRSNNKPIKSLMLLLVLMVSPLLKVQSQDGYSVRQLSDMVGQLNWERSMREGNPNVEGSPYLHDDFIKGDVYYDKEYKVEQVPLRLNLYNDEFEYQEKGAVMAFSNPQRIDQIVVGDEVYIYLPKVDKSPVSGYVRKWNDKFPCLITKMKTEFLEKEEPKPYVEAKPDRFERAYDKNFIMLSGSEIEKVTSVKKLIKLLGNHGSELTAFAKKEKISSGDPKEIARLLDHYHELN